MQQPNEPDPAEAGRLEQEAKVLAHEATQVHKWLKPKLRESLAAKSAYAFKDRLKPWDKIKKKVIHERHKKSIQ